MKKEEVKSVLEAWLNGSLDSADWDYFISVGNKEPTLDKIRMEAQGMWVENSPFLEPGAINPCALSASGREKVIELLRLCEASDG